MRVRRKATYQGSGQPKGATASDTGARSKDTRRRILTCGAANQRSGRRPASKPNPPHAQVWRVSAYAGSEVATMKLGIASREGAITTDEDAREFARMIEEQAKDDDWIRVLYAIDTDDTAAVDVLTFRLDKTG